MISLITILAALTALFHPIPEPQDISYKNAKAFNWNELSYVIAEGDATYPVMDDMLSALPRVKTAGKGVVLTLAESGVPESEEAYVLETDKNGAKVLARSWKGLFYGLKTLEQYLQDSRDRGVPVPAMKITDFPKLDYRAIYLDTKHHLDRIEFYYDIIDRLSQFKINGIIWEIEDKLGYTRHPEIASPTHITKQEMQAICKYGEERNVSISPLIQGLGHASFILKHHWELRENPESDWEFCPSNPATYEMQFDLYEDALEAMPYGKYLHVGGDEISAIGIDERCKATGKNAFELQMEWLRKVCDFATSHGRIPIFWDDMVFKYGEVWDYMTSTKYSAEEISAKWNTAKLDAAIDLFPKECVYMRWCYSNTLNPGNVRAIKWYKEKGLNVIGACGAGGTIMPRDNGRIVDIHGFDNLAAESGFSGMLCTNWEDGSCHLETVFRGFLAHAQCTWNPAVFTPETYNEAHAWRYYGCENATAFLPMLDQSMNRYYNILVQKGRRDRGYATKTDFVLIDLPTADKGAWSAKYADKLADVKESAAVYEQIRDGIAYTSANARRNRYSLEIYGCINELQNFTTRLMLALERYDKGEVKDKSEIAQICNSFPELRESIVASYSKTRHMSNPAGYLMDMNAHNHLAARTNDDAWMFYYEIPFVKKVLKWCNN